MRNFFIRVHLGLLHIYISVLDRLAGLVDHRVVHQADVRLLSDLVDNYRGLIGTYGTRLSRRGARERAVRLLNGFQFARGRLRGTA